MPFIFINLVKMNKIGYHLEMLSNFLFSKNRFFLKMLKKPSILGNELFFYKYMNIFFK